MRSALISALLTALEPDLPPLSDCLLFPSFPVLTECIAFNRAHAKWLNERASVVESATLTAAMQETNQIYRVWDLARDARNECLHPSTRRRALAELQRLIGDDYELPPCVPVWRFADR